MEQDRPTNAGPPVYLTRDPSAAALADDLVRGQIAEAIEQAGGPYKPPEGERGAVGRTAFDSPTSKDGTITVLLPQDDIGKVPSQTLVRIESKDGRAYLAVVVEGPFAEPDGLRADAPIMVTTTVRGAVLMPRYHGRVHVELMGERYEDGTLVPPRFRPLPNSPVFVLGPAETAAALRLGGDLRIGRAIGQDDVAVAVPTGSKEVLPRHTAVLGTTGGGKSTTIAGFIARLQAAGVATVVFDVEGEYTALREPTADPGMLSALARAGMAAAGVRGTELFHLVGRETRNPGHPRRHPFGLRFASLAPQTVMEILDINDAQSDRFLWAYDAARRFVDQARLLTDAERDALIELDELETGHPRVTLALVYDLVAGAGARAGKDQQSDLAPRSPEVRAHPEAFAAAFEGGDKPTSRASWRALQGKLGRVLRLNVFDRPDARIDYDELVKPGRVSIVDMSDTDAPQVNNLVIADLLRNVLRVQDERYEQARAQGTPPVPTVVIVEEAHEFLSAARIKQMPVLFEQVTRIARRGRKRWLGLVFVTQLPQHLPDEVFGLVNNHVLHKIADPGVVDRLRKTIGGIDRSLWERLPTLAPGQAIVSFGGMTRPLLTAVDPAPARLLLAE